MIGRLAGGFATVVFAVGWTAASAPAQPRCPETGAPSASVSGSPEASDVVRALGARGVVAASARCAAVRVSVGATENGLDVTVRAPDGHRAHRRISTAEMAAVWIDTWVRDDVVAPLLAVPVPPPSMAHAMPAEPMRAPALSPPGDVAPRSHHASDRHRVSLGAAAAYLSGDEGSSSRAVHLNACLAAGPLCVGVDGSYADGSSIAPEDNMTVTRRRGADLMASARWPLALGRAVLAPSVAVGMGWVRTEKNWPNMAPDPANPADPCGPDGSLCCAPTDPNCVPPPPPYTTIDHYSVDTLGIRAGGSLSLTLPVTDNVAVELSAGAVFAPSAHTDRVDPYAADRADPTQNPPPADHLNTLPGEPGRYTWLGLGLRVGLP